MQERSYTLPMCSVGRTSHVPSSIGNISNDIHSSSSTTTESNEIESTIESSNSTPELNLLLVRKENQRNRSIYSFFHLRFRIN